MRRSPESRADAAASIRWADDASLVNEGHCRAKVGHAAANTRGAQRGDACCENSDDGVVHGGGRVDAVCVSCSVVKTMWRERSKGRHNAERFSRHFRSSPRRQLKINRFRRV